MKLCQTRHGRDDEHPADGVALLRPADRETDREPADADDQGDRGRPQREPPAPLEQRRVHGHSRGHGVRPRMPATVGAVRAAAGASKNGIAVTPATPAMIWPGKIWIALFSWLTAAL